MIGLSVHTAAPRAAGPRATDEEVGRALALYFNIRDTSAPGFGRLLASAKTMVVTQGIPSGQLEALRSLMQSLTAEAAREGYATSPAAQAHFNNVNIHGSEFANLETRGLVRGPGLDVAALALAAAASRSDYGPLRTASGDFSDVRNVTPANFDRTPFAALGLNWNTFNDLRGQGFGDMQIRAAARTTTALGIDVNRHAPAVARLSRDIPSAIPGLHTTRDKWRAIGDLERRKREAEARGDTTGAAALAQQIEAQRREAEAHDRRERERIQRERPDRLPDFDQVQQDTRRRALESRLNPHAPQADGPVVPELSRAEERSRDVVAARLDTQVRRADSTTRADLSAEAANLIDGPAPTTRAAAPSPTATAAASRPAVPTVRPA